MIHREFYRQREDGVNLYRTYSDSGLQIKQVGTNKVYLEAIDVENSDFVYEEIPYIPIEIEEAPNVEPEEENQSI